MNRLLALMITIMLLVLGIGASTVLQVVPLFMKYVILGCSMIFFYIVVLGVLEEHTPTKNTNGKLNNNDNLQR